jgi:hypothetical protein
MRDLYVLIDDLPEQTLLYPRSLEVEVAAGPHQIKVTNRLFTAVSHCDLIEDEVAEFEVGNVSAGCLFAPLIVMGGTGAYRVMISRR